MEMVREETISGEEKRRSENQGGQKSRLSAPRFVDYAYVMYILRRNALHRTEEAGPAYALFLGLPLDLALGAGEGGTIG